MTESSKENKSKNNKIKDNKFWKIKDKGLRGNIKNDLKIFFLTMLVILLITFFTFLIYSNLNKKSGLDGIFHMFNKKYLTTEEAANVSKKYIELVYKMKVEDYNIASKDNKYYFSSSVADLVLDKYDGKKYFDLITTKEDKMKTGISVKKEDEIKEVIYEEVKPSIYISDKETKKVDVKSKDVIEELSKETAKVNEKLVLEEIKEKIYVEDGSFLEGKDKKIDDTLKQEIIDKINRAHEIQKKLDELYKEKKKYQEKDEIKKADDIKEEIKKLTEDLDKNKKIKIEDKEISFEKIINRKVNEIISFLEKEKYIKDKNKEKTYTNSKRYLDGLILGSFDKEEKIAVMTKNGIYIFKQVDLDEYIKNTKEKVERIETKAKKMKNSIFNTKMFEKYVITDEIDVKPDTKDVSCYFYLVENGIVNKVSYIKMNFNKQNEKLLEIKVNVNSIPYSEIKITRYDAANIAYNFLEKNDYIKNDEFKLGKNKTLNDILEYTKVEIDMTNEFYKKGEIKTVEKMWKVKFKDIPYEVFVDTYFGNILGGKKA